MFPPSLSLTPDQFEKFVASLFSAMPCTVERHSVTHSQNVEGVDGTYEIDLVITFESMGMGYRTLVECKHHKNPIKRDTVQILHSKLQSTGSQKGAIVSTSCFQKGAIEFAQAHGIALIQLVDGEIAYATRSLSKPATRPTWIPSTAAYMNTFSKEGHLGLKLILPGDFWFD